MFDLKATGVSDTEICDPVVRSKRIKVGTEQQEYFWSQLVDTDRNVLVEARAGCGKSSSCREGLHRLVEKDPRQKLAYAVFNKANADEFRQDCPSGVNVGTVHSFGFAALRRAFNSQVEKNKSYLVLDDLPGGRDLARYLRKSVAMLVGLAKNQGFHPREYTAAQLETLVLHFDVATYHQTPRVVDWAAKVLDKSAEWTSLVDFDDMIWLPSVHGLDFDPCDVLFLDEVQDWNPAQHDLIPLLAKAGRVVAVGDPYQAIYAWRGADPDSMGRLAHQLGENRPLARLPLTLTFRCPKSHVRLANQFVPDLQAHACNSEGTITRVAPNAPLDTRPGDMVLSRTNAAVIRAALQKIADHQPALVRGRALGDQLVQIVRNCGECRTTSDLTAKVAAWRNRELLRLLDQEGVEDLIEEVSDRAAGLTAILMKCQTPGEVEPAIGALFADRPPSGVAQFSTIHRAKGAEANRVWILEDKPRTENLTDPPPEWKVQQDRNLAYVSLTRSKADLFLVPPTL